jgi:hypothetical protein
LIRKPEIRRRCNMKRRMEILISLVLLLIMLLSVSAAGSMLVPGSEKGRDNSKAGASPADPPGLEKRVFIHYKKGHAKPPWAGGDKDKGKTTCYTFLAKDAKWKTVEPYYINPTNIDEVSEAMLTASTTAGVDAWETGATYNILGDGIVSYSASYNNGAYDGDNTLSFGSVSEPGAIAVTTVWGYFGGPPRFRELLEWDMLLDDGFDWGNSDVEPQKMDVQNIITHELGHAVGMGDLYEAGCAEETMYGYSTEGDTEKRDLNSGDIEGINKLY